MSGRNVYTTWRDLCTCQHGACILHERELDMLREHPTLARFRAVLGVIGYAAAHCRWCLQLRAVCDAVPHERRGTACTGRILDELEHHLQQTLYSALRDAPAKLPRTKPAEDLLCDLLGPHLHAALADAEARGIVKAHDFDIKVAAQPDGSMRWSAMVPASWVDWYCHACERGFLASQVTTPRADGSAPCPECGSVYDLQNLREVRP